MSTLAKALLLICLFGGATALYALFQLIFEAETLNELALGVATFGCLGLLLGGIFAFDERSEIKIRANAFARIAVGSIAGVAVSLLWGWSGEGVALSALVGGSLGYFGMVWAKYVDF